jgi:hypothetical protein
LARPYPGGGRKDKKKLAIRPAAAEGGVEPAPDRSLHVQRLRPHRPSPALVIALLALFVALGGTGYAALKLPKNSVGNKQLRKNAVTSAKIKNGSLVSGDFKKGQIHAGPRGLQGERGPQGIQGEAGRSALTPLRSGEVIRGSAGISGTGSSGLPVKTFITLPVPAPVALDDAHVSVNNGDEAQNECQGNNANPDASPGYACIYLDGVSNLTNFQGGEPTSAGAAYGFIIQGTAGNAMTNWVNAQGSWAYRAP